MSRPTWVGLFSESLVGWLENENRLADLCGTARADDSERWARCVAEKMRPRVATWQLHERPDSDSPTIGSLMVAAVPGRGLAAFYVASEESEGRPFQPDLYDQDWGYGPYFHQTLLDRRDRWFLLPGDPFPRPVWAELGSVDGDGPPLASPYEGQVLHSPIGDVVVLEVGDGILRVRSEQPADMWCEEGDQPPLAPWEEVVLSAAELYDERGHLTVRPKYLRGC